MNVFQCGFFKRQKHEEMLAMQHTAEVEKMLPDDEVERVGKNVTTPE